MKKLIALLLALVALPAAAAQNSLYNTTTGTLPGLTMIQNYNAAHTTLASNFSGNAAPASPIGFQFWADTGSSPNLLKLYDGASWLTLGQIDTSGHNFNPRGAGASFTTLATSGAATLNSATVTNNATVSGNLAVTGTSAFTGTIGLGGSAASSAGMVILNTNLTGTAQLGISNNVVFSSANTGNGYGFLSAPSTAAGAYTASGVVHYSALDVTVGSGSTVTNQYGFYCDVNTAATNNYCFYNANAGAKNYLGGKTLIGPTSFNQGQLQVFANIAGGAPQTSGSTDANTVYRWAGGSVAVDSGFYATGNAWMQARSGSNNATNFALSINPNGGAVLLPSVYGNTTASAANVNIDSTGNLFRSTSSRRYKHDIQDYTRGISDVMALRPVFYKGNNDGAKQYAGLIAEEVDEAGLVEFVQYDNQNQPDSLYYSNMVALSFKALQDLKHENDSLREEIAAIKSHVGMQ